MGFLRIMRRCLKPVARRIGVALTQNVGWRRWGGQWAARLPVAEAELSPMTYAFLG